MIGEWNNGTGRRKSSVARVFLKKGTGKITVNGKDIQAYFGRETSIMIAKQPLFLTNHVESFDIQINVHGGEHFMGVGNARVAGCGGLNAGCTRSGCGAGCTDHDCTECCEHVMGFCDAWMAGCAGIDVASTGGGC